MVRGTRRLQSNGLMGWDDHEDVRGIDRNFG